MKFLFLAAIYFILSLPAYCQELDIFNSPPTIDKIPDYGPIPENAGDQIIILTGISDGDYNKEQIVTITAFTNNGDLISNLKVEYDQGTTAVLFFAPKLNANGRATITIRLDDGQRWRNITETSFDVTVFAVNGKPSFQLSSNLIRIDENNGEVVMKKFATEINDGDPELKQKLKFITTIKSVTGNLTFKSVPEIDVKSGDLKFEINTNTFGDAAISVLLKDNGGTNNGGIDTSDESIFTIRVNIINDPPTLNDIPTPLTLFEDAGEQIVELTGISSGANENQNLTISAVSDNQELIPTIIIEYNAGETTANLKFSPSSNRFGNAIITVTVDDGQSQNNSISKQFSVIINPVADTPGVTDAISKGSKQTTSGLVISRNPVDGNEVTHFKINEIINGTLYLNNGVSRIQNNEFITFQEGNKGLKFTPGDGVSDPGSFKIQAATGADDSHLGGSIVTAQIIIENDSPTLNDIPTPLILFEDAGEQIVELTGISSGANENQNLTISAVSDNQELIPTIIIEYNAGETTANLKFSPGSNRFGNAIITVTIDDGQSQNNSISKQFSVIINPVADTPGVTDAISKGSKQTTSGLVISRNPVDGNEVTHFKINEIINGILYHNDGVSQIQNNEFITSSEGNMGLKFTPSDGVSDPGSFKIQAATGADDSHLGGGL